MWGATVCNHKVLFLVWLCGTYPWIPPITVPSSVPFHHAVIIKLHTITIVWLSSLTNVYSLCIPHTHPWTYLHINRPAEFDCNVIKPMPIFMWYITIMLPDRKVLQLLCITMELFRYLWFNAVYYYRLGTIAIKDYLFLQLSISCKSMSCKEAYPWNCIIWYFIQLWWYIFWLQKLKYIIGCFHKIFSQACTTSLCFLILLCYAQCVCVCMSTP